MAYTSITALSYSEIAKKGQKGLNRDQSMARIALSDATPQARKAVACIEFR